MVATIAFEAGIIAPQFFTALVLTAIFTSQFTGWWLGRVLANRGTLLGERIRADPDIVAGDAGAVPVP